MIYPDLDSFDLQRNSNLRRRATSSRKRVRKEYRLKLDKKNKMKFMIEIPTKEYMVVDLLREGNVILIDPTQKELKIKA